METMSRKSKCSFASLISFVVVLLASGAPLLAQTTFKQPLITQPIDERNLVTLVGNTRPEAIPANDRGPVADDLPLDHMYLQLKRSPAQQKAVDELINQLHDQNSPQYHQWLTADQIASQFGPAEEDVQTISSWLTSHGFTVNVVYGANGVIDFSGPASAIRGAFHTEIHNLIVNGTPHIANMSDPQIPAALAPAVQGVVSMHDFRPRPTYRPRAQYTFCCLLGSTWQALVPGDVATIYKINPIYAAGVSGQGQTIVALEDTDVYNPDDWYAFRKTFGLTTNFPQGSFQQIHPQPSKNPNNGGTCTDPGVNPDDVEAIIDAEWASAAAPSAAIVLATCADTNTNFGGFIALQNLLTAPGKPPAIVSIGYSSSEPSNGASFNQMVNELYEIGVLQGVSIFVSAGDGGAASTDTSAAAAMSGINVSGFASTPNNVAVGGTDFGDTYLGEVSTYWSSTNGKYFNSALSYIPEIPWNDSCASQLATTALGFATPYGTNGLCNSPLGEQLYLATVAGSGGPSGCAYGTPSIQDEINNPNGTYAVVSGTCKGYAKPPYQSDVSGNPRDGVRDLPDVSLFAGNGLWGHLYIFCFSDPNNGGTPCVGAPSDWSLGGGTSFAAPIMAGIQAMINQTSGGNQGNPNFVYYALAALEYDYGGTGACNSTLGNKVGPACIFHDVTLGDNDVNCLPLVVDGVTLGTFNCFLDGATNGVLSLSNSSYEPAYRATPDWDFATGLGSVNAYNLVKAWPGSRLP
jgi:subtilase family serine protease